MAVNVFRLQGRKPDKRLSSVEAARYTAWLNLRVALRGSGARQDDRQEALSRLRLTLRDLLPEIQKELSREPTGPPKMIIRNGVLEAKPGPWAVWEIPFNQETIKESRGTLTPQSAYDYWTKKMMGRTHVVEWRGGSAVLCNDIEVAHYALAVLGGKQGACLQCHRLFLKAREDAQYCSSKCKWAKQKFNQRHKR
jgi:hypothetical protein